jgi:hypothetical protein
MPHREQSTYGNGLEGVNPRIGLISLLTSNEVPKVSRIEILVGIKLK